MSLVDPRISRDGVPLCARHADATSPPMGWTMNDLRSRNRALSAVPDEGSIPTSTPPRVRPEPAAGGDGAGRVERSRAAADTGDSNGTGRTMPRRQSIAERVRQTGEVERVSAEDAADDHKFRNSRPAADNGASAAPASSKRSKAGDDAPESRPTRRRDIPEDVDEPEERFPWHHQYQDDEPEEMQASSPLLSRAFRSSTG
ncbi:MAG: hypothetical protein AAFO29_14415 [Actinomycetota bacterium]